MIDLLIGNTSQLSKYFPSNILKISSRNINDEIFKKNWKNVYICFAEQRTYITDNPIFNEINFNFTKSILSKLKADKIFFYSTAELWNNCIGPISINDQYNYHSSDYLDSKKLITEYIKNNFSNSIILYPFNFNSRFRKPPFLFGKIIESIAFKKPIQIGDTHYRRELLHPSFVVQETLKATNHQIIGSGVTIHINNFIKKLYYEFGMNYDLYVEEKIIPKSFYRENVFYSSNKIENYEKTIMNLMIKEIEEKKNGYSY